MPRKKKRSFGRVPEHVRVYQQFQDMEAWLENEEETTFNHCGTIIRKDEVSLKKHPGKDSVSLVREIFQGEKKDQCTIWHNGKYWRVTVVTRKDEDKSREVVVLESLIEWLENGQNKDSFVINDWTIVKAAVKPTVVPSNTVDDIISEVVEGPGDVVVMAIVHNNQSWLINATRAEDD